VLKNGEMERGGQTWSLVIATYQREDVLRRCLKLAATQTRPPAEIIVVDSSTNWEATRSWTLGELAPEYPAIQWHYVEAVTRSSGAQRNQGARLASSDVLFLIDDDSLMYPDCAEKIMEVYDADVGRQIVGVNAVHVPEPPDEPNESADPEYGTTKNYSAVARFTRRLLNADDIFIPYEAEWPRLPIPEAVAKLKVSRWTNAAGWGMTFRREICLKEPFDEILAAYSAQEDSDMSYRATRRGAFVGHDEARLCHIGSRGGRLSILTVSTLKGLNSLVLHRLNTDDVERGRTLSRRLLWRRTVIALAKDVQKRRWGCPDARGWFRAARMVDRIFDQTPDELRAWYPRLQSSLLADPGTARTKS
jgi:GT2 family glycosyltransferase